MRFQTPEAAGLTPLRPLPPARNSKRKLAPPTANGAITSNLVYYTVSTLKSEDAVIVEEAPSTQAVLRDWLPTSQSRSFFSMFSGVLGYGLPAACGVCLAERDGGRSRKVICFEGDGSAQFTIQAFWNAAQQKLPILFILFRNHEYAVLQSYADLFELKGVPGLKIPGVDIESLAKAYGVRGETVRDAEFLSDALKRGLEHDGPYVLQIDILPTIPPLLGASGPKTQRETL
jgi:benzoylformate decarboxylase